MSVDTAYLGLHHTALSRPSWDLLEMVGVDTNSTEVDEIKYGMKKYIKG